MKNNKIFKSKMMVLLLMLVPACITQPSDGGCDGGAALLDFDDLLPSTLQVALDDVQRMIGEGFFDDLVSDSSHACSSGALGSRKHLLEAPSFEPASAFATSGVSTAVSASANSTLIAGSYVAVAASGMAAQAGVVFSKGSGAVPSSAKQQAIKHSPVSTNLANASAGSANVGSSDINAGAIKDSDDLKKKLFQVISKGKLQDINEILSRLHTLNFLSQNQKSPCHFAAINFKIGILKYFLTTGYDLHPSDSTNLLDVINQKKREIKSDVLNSKDVPVRHKVYHRTICKIEQLLLCDTGGLAGTNRFSYTTTEAKYRDVACVGAGKAKIIPVRMRARGGSAQAADSSSAHAASVISTNVGSLRAWQKCLFNNIKNRNVKDLSECLKQMPNHYRVGLAFFNEDGFTPLRLVCTSSNHSIKFLQKLLLSGLRPHEDDARGLLAYVSNKIKHSKSLGTVYRYERIQKLLREDGRFTCTDELTAAASGGGAAAMVPKHPAKRSATAASSSAAHPVASVQKAKRPKAKATTKANAGGASGADSQGEGDGEL
jgi:hypothetical protein